MTIRRLAIMLASTFALILSGGCQSREATTYEDFLHPITIITRQVDGKLEAEITNDSHEIIEVMKLTWELRPVVGDADRRKGLTATNFMYLSYWAEIDEAKLYFPARESPNYHKREATLGDRVWIYPGATVTFKGILDLRGESFFKDITQYDARVVASIFRKAVPRYAVRPELLPSQYITVRWDSLNPKPQ